MPTRSPKNSRPTDLRVDRKKLPTSHGAIPFRRRLFQRLPRTTWESWKWFSGCCFEKPPICKHMCKSNWIKKKQHLVFFKRPAARKICLLWNYIWFNENNPNTHSQTHWWLMTVPPSSFFATCSSTVSLCPRKTKRIAAKKSRTFRWSFASSQVLQRQPQVNRPLKSCHSVSIRIGSETIPGVWGDCGGFNRGYMAVTGIDSSCGLVSSSCVLQQL